MNDDAPVNPFASPETDESPVADVGHVEVGDTSCYRPAQGLGRAVRAAYWTLILVVAACIGCELWYLATVGQYWDAGALGPAASAANALLVAYYVNFVVLTVLYCKWKYRCYQNLAAFGVEDARYSPSWAAACYFVPIANLFVPYRAMKDVMNGAIRQPVESAAGLVSAWWAFSLLSRFLQSASARMALSAQTLVEVQATSVLQLIADSLLIVCCALTIRVVRRVDLRQLETATKLGLETAPRFTIE